MSDEPFTLTSEAAKELSQLGAAKGGTARAQKLTPARRSEIARAAGEARWLKAGKEPLPRATHGSPDRPLVIGGIVLSAYVLADGTRVLAQRGLQSGIGLSESGGSGGERRITALMKRLQGKGIDVRDLIARTNSPIRFIPPHGGNPADGYDALILPDICRVLIDAQRQGKLDVRLLRLAERAAILQHGFAVVGITALVDEATGYQDDRAKDALTKILEAFVAKELRPYLKTFPSDFYKEMYRLRGWHWPSLPAAQSRRSPLVGKFTDNLVYERLAPGVKDRLKELVGRDESGRLKHKMFQRLTDDIGEPKLLQHLSSVVTLMRASDDWKQFMKMLDRSLPRHKAMPLFDDPKEMKS
jgi:P63C domain